jgi:hypothetical protein
MLKIPGMGAIYRYKVQDPMVDAASFIFVPTDPRRQVVEISFFKADPAYRKYADWRVAPQTPYDAKNYTEALRRFDFAGATRTDCLELRRAG